MEKLTQNVKNGLRKIAASYVKAMTLYGEAFLAMKGIA